MIQFLKRHGLALIFACTIGLLIIWPTFSAIRQIGPDFKGIYPMLSNDEDQYLAMTREAYDGHYNFGSVYLKEHKDVPYLQQPLAEIIFSGTAKFFNKSVPALFAVNDFALPFIGVLTLYFLMLSLTESGIIAGFFSALYYFLFISQFNRPINPQFSFLFLFLGLQLIWKIMNNEKRSLKKFLILNFALSAVFGTAFYIYPFVWSSIFVVYCLALLSLSVRFHEIKYFFKNFLAFAVPAAIFTVPYILNLRRAAMDANYLEQNLRFGFLTTHWPHAYFNVSLMVLSLIVLYLIGKDANSNRKIFGYCLALAGVILNWQNVLTGKAFSFSMHYYWVAVLFLFIIFSICAAILVNNHKNNLLRRRDLLVIFLILISSFSLLRKERGAGPIDFSMLSGSVDSAQLRDIQSLAGVSDWFEKNSPKDSAVMSFGKDYYWFIPAYTSNNDFQNANAGLFLISDDELENRWAIQNFFRKGIDEEYVKRHNVEIWANKFIEKYQNEKIRNKILNLIWLGKSEDSIIFMPAEYADRILMKLERYRKAGFEESLKQYSVDYILLDKNDAEFGFLADKFKAAPFLSLEAEIENHLVFKIVK